MRLHKTGHPIADTVSDLIGELPDGDYKIAYGILRHEEFSMGLRWFEMDKGLWAANHYGGNYRLSFQGTQPIWHKDGPSEDHRLDLEPWRHQTGPALICPPTSHVCDFFNIDYSSWLTKAIRQAEGPYIIRTKGVENPIEWDKISKLITFNSTLGIEALIKGIPVISDPDHSTIGSYAVENYILDGTNRDELLSFCAAHQFKLSDKSKICRLIEHYLSIPSSGGIPEKQ